MSCIVVVGGLIGCGKSTLVRFFLDNYNELFNSSISDESINESEISKQNRTYKIIFDELCTIKEQEEMMKTVKGWKHFRLDLLMAAEFFICSTCNLERQIYGPLSQRTQNLLDHLYTLNNSISISDKGIYFVEDNFYYRSMRYDWFQIARRNNIGFCEVFVQCPLNMAIYRNFVRSYSIPEDAIKRMLNYMEYPNPVQYKWEKYSMVFDFSTDPTCSKLKPIVKLIEEATDNPAELMFNEEKIKSQKVCSKNAVHQADNILRKLISKKILFLKENISNKDDLNSLVSFSIEAKQALLNGIRNGEVHLPKDILDKLKELGIDKIRQEYEDVLNELFENALQYKMMDANFLSTSFCNTLNLADGDSS